MTTPEDRLHEWGLAFMTNADHSVMHSKDDILITSWAAGDFDYCYEWIKQTYPELEEDQLEWIEEFMAELSE
jgi:hypothetical protein